MARRQLPRQFQIAGITGTPIQFSVTSIECTSFIVQAPVSNTDFIEVGDSTGQIFQIAPGRDLSFHGDALDNGTFAYIDFTEWYIKSVSGTQVANVLYAERY